MGAYRIYDRAIRDKIYLPAEGDAGGFGIFFIIAALKGLDEEEVSTGRAEGDIADAEGEVILFAAAPFDGDDIFNGGSALGVSFIFREANEPEAVGRDAAVLGKAILFKVMLDFLFGFIPNAGDGEAGEPRSAGRVCFLVIMDEEAGRGFGCIFEAEDEGQIHMERKPKLFVFSVFAFDVEPRSIGEVEDLRGLGACRGAGRILQGITHVELDAVGSFDIRQEIDACRLRGLRVGRVELQEEILGIDVIGLNGGFVGSRPMFGLRFEDAAGGDIEMEMVGQIPFLAAYGADEVAYQDRLSGMDIEGC